MGLLGSIGDGIGGMLQKWGDRDFWERRDHVLRGGSGAEWDAQKRMLEQQQKDEEARRQFFEANKNRFKGPMAPPDVNERMSMMMGSGVPEYQDMAMRMMMQGPSANANPMKTFEPRPYTRPDGSIGIGMPQFNPATGATNWSDMGDPVKEDLKLSPTVQKMLSETQDDYMTSSENARMYGVLASDIEKTPNFGAGIFSSWGDAYKNLTGTQDAVSELRQRYNAVRASAVVNNLPPGAASDTDIKLALSGFPPDNANGQTLSAFLRGVAKLEDIKAQYSRIKAGLIGKQGDSTGLIEKWDAFLKDYKPAGGWNSAPTTAPSAPPKQAVRTSNRGVRNHKSSSGIQFTVSD